MTCTGYGEMLVGEPQTGAGSCESLERLDGRSIEQRSVGVPRRIDDVVGRIQCHNGDIFE
jgi:hypothetical protein